MNLRARRGSGTARPPATAAPRRQAQPRVDVGAGRDRVRVLLVSHSGNLFGAERSLLQLAQSLHADPAFHLLVLVPGEGGLAQRCRESGIDVLVRGYPMWVSPRRRLRGVLRRSLRHLTSLCAALRPVRRFAPDLIYTSTGAVPIGALLSRMLGVPHIWHMRELVRENRNLRYDLGERLTRRLIRLSATRVVSNSRAVGESFAEFLGRDDVVTVYNGFSFPPPAEEDGEARFRALSEAGTAELLYVGGVIPSKGLEDAVVSVAALSERGLAVRLTIAGHGDVRYTERLNETAARLGVAERIRFLGFVEDTAALYQRAAVTLICSRSEAFGRVAVESLAAGTPVVCTGIDGLLEIVEPGRTGLVYRPGDAEELADAVARLLREPALYRRISDTGRFLVRRRFGAERYARELGDLFRQTLGLETT